ncbi:MAG: twin-arginine translocase subunit TatC [Halobacteriales archaeon]
MASEGGDEGSDAADRPPRTDADGGHPAGESSAVESGRRAGVGGLGTPPDDVEMPLTEHIEEMLRRLVVVAVLGGIATLVAYPFAGDVVTTMWYDIHPGTAGTCVPDPESTGCAPPHVYGPLELVLTEIKVAALAGIVVALPAVVYQTYQFMRPGLYAHERRYYLSSVPMSLVLALAGMAFAYFVVLPILFTVFLHYSEGSAEVAFALQDTFDLLLIMMFTLAIVFQIPLFLMLAIMMGVTSRRWLEDRRIYFWIGFSGLAFVFSPDPTGMAPVVVAVTMIGLFEGTLAVLRWSAQGAFSPTPAQVARLRPIAWLVAALVGYLLSPLPPPVGLYDRLPADVVGPLEGAGVAPLVAVAIGAAVILGFEVLLRALRRRRLAPRLRRALIRLRVPVWVVGIVLGYLATPEPGLLALLEVSVVELPAAAAVALGLVVAFEVGLAGWRWIRAA